MFKTGVCSLEELTTGQNDRTLFRRDFKNVSISLYEQACAAENADSLTERILLLFSDARGAYKRTYNKRFEEFDARVYQILESHFTPDKNLNIHDVAISDGRTSVDFFEGISKHFSDINYTASDYNPIVKTIEDGKLKITLSGNDELLEFTYPPFVFNAVKRDSYLLYPLNHFIKYFVKIFKVNPIIEKYKKGLINAKKVFLFAPCAINLQKQNEKFNLSQHDILNSFQGKYHIIRAMNILNPSYFLDSDFPKIIKHIYSALNDDGIFITGSNQDAGTVVNGAVYKKIENGFELIWKSNSGSPVSEFIKKI